MGAYSDIILGSGSTLLSYWKLGEASGNVADSKGSLTGTAAGLTYSQAGAYTALGNSVLAGGTSSSYIKFGNNLAFSGTSNFTLEAWVNRGTDVAGRFISKYDEAVGNGYLFGLDASVGKLYCGRHNGSGGEFLTGTTTLSASTWYHVAMTYDGSNMRLYVNGVLDGTQASTRSVGSPTSYEFTLFQPAIGNASPSAALCIAGNMQHVAVYDTPLSAGTLLAHYDAGGDLVTTFTADAIVQGAMEKMFTADAIVSGTNTQTATADAVVSDRVEDTFTDSNGTVLSSHTPTGTFASGSWAAFYVPTDSRLLVTSNRVYAYFSSAVAVTSTYRHLRQLTDGRLAVDLIPKSGGYALIGLRHTGANNTVESAYQVIFDNGGNGSAGTLTLRKAVSGSYTTLGTYSMGSLTTDATYRVELDVNGTSIRAIFQGQAVISATDSSVTGIGYAEVQLNSPNGASTSSGVHLGNFYLTAAATTPTTTFTADAVVYYSPEKTFTVDAIVSGTNTATVTADGIVTASASKTFTADAVVNGTMYGTPSGSRSAYAAAATVIAGGTVGTKYAHRAFATGALADNGNLIVSYRRGTREPSVDGSACIVIGTPDGSGGFTFGSEQTVIDGTLTDSIYSGTTAVSPLPNGYRPAVRDVHIRTFASGRIGMQFTQQRSGTIETSAGVFNPSFLSGAYWCTWFCYSDDDGATWSTPVEVTFTGSGAPTFSYGCFGDELFELANGTLLVACYALNSAATSFTAHLARSTDGGTTWSYLSQISSTIGGYNAVETSLAQLPDGTVLAAFHTEDGLPTDMYLKRSSDNGATWGSAVTIATSESTNRNAILYGPDGDLINAYAHAVTGFPQGYTLSTDGGTSWGSWTQVDTATAHSMTGGADWIHPVAIGSAGVSPNLAFLYAWENSGQDGASIFIRTYGAGGTAYVQRTGAFTADAVVSTRSEITVTGDAVVISSFSTQGTRSFTADALVAEPGLTKTFTADAVVSETVVGLQTFTKTVTADALVDSSPGALFTAGLFFYSNVGQHLEFWGQD